MKPIILVHGGAGSPEDYKDGTDAAAKAGWRLLEHGGTAMEAVEAAVKTMEDDERYNAGTGSYMNLDGDIEMDAAVMDSSGNCGAVAAIKRVQYPVSVARKVMESPHIFLVGQGALDFARENGFPDHDPSTEKAVKKLVNVKSSLKNGKFPEWNKKWQDFQYGGDTVGAVARDSDGNFAAAGSTGGTSWQLRGRVGDSPIIGAGIYAGPEGAVVATGIGEEIIRKVLSKGVYDIMSLRTCQEACEWGISQYEKKISVGVLAVNKDGWGSYCNRTMAYSVME